jgi:phospholipase C
VPCAAKEPIPRLDETAEEFGRTAASGCGGDESGPGNKNSYGGNRFFLWTATIDPGGEDGGPALDNGGRRYAWETYPERLERAGISWCIYHENERTSLNACRYFAQFQDAPTTSPLYHKAMKSRSFAELVADLKSGNIPQVTWIVPPVAATEHPPFLPAAGEDYTRRILEALWANPSLWSRTVFIQNYDENDGLFDHVAPPTPEPGTSDEFVGGAPIGLGFRVPCLVISPFSRGGYVCSEVFDHTSTLRFIEARFGVEVGNLSAWRRRITGDLTRALRFDEAPRSDVPASPETEQALQRAERNATSLPAPKVPDSQSVTSQETGARPKVA